MNYRVKPRRLSNVPYRYNAAQSDFETKTMTTYLVISSNEEVVASSVTEWIANDIANFLNSKHQWLPQ